MTKQIVPAHLAPELIGSIVIIQAHPRARPESDELLPEFTKSVGILAGYGIDGTRTGIVLRDVPEPLRFDSNLHYVEYWRYE